VSLKELSCPSGRDRGKEPHKTTAKKHRPLPLYSLYERREENTTFIRRKSCSIDFIPRNGKQPNTSAEEGEIFQ
jgi:hypothetical protein